MNNSQDQIKDQRSQLPPDLHLNILSAEENKNSTTGKTFPNFNTRENLIAPSFRYPNKPTMPTPTDRNVSFSDIISPQNIHTVVNMSLEKELDNNVRKSLNTMSDRSNIFEQSSIHKEESNKQENRSGFDVKEQDSLLNDNTPNNQAKSQPNKRICILCHNSHKMQAAILGDKPPKVRDTVKEYDLIYPCLCNIKAHRECLKSYLLLKKIVTCERCKTAYAISGKTMKETSLPRTNAIAMAVVTLLCIGIALGGIILVVIALGNSQTPIIAAGVVMLLVGIVGIGYLCWRKYFSKRIVDVAVHCKQTEIARHREHPEQTLLKFVEQEEKRSSRILKRAKKLLDLLDVAEFETFIKMTTPRLDKPDKGNQRKGSSNMLLSDQSKHKGDEEEENLKKAVKEIFIVPTEVKVTIEKSENTIPDNPSNVNEYSKIKTHAVPHVRITASNPSKFEPIPPKEQARSGRPEMRRIIIAGSQSERRYNDPGRKPQPQPAKLVKLPLKETAQSAYTLENPQGMTTREKTNPPYFTTNEGGLPKPDLAEVQSKKLEE